MIRTQATRQTPGRRMAMPSEPSGLDPDAVDAQLRAQGFRTTAQRRLVLAAVNDLGHASAEEVLTRVNLTDPAVNLSTVYRSLEVLEEVGLLRHTHIGHNSVTYHANSDTSHLHVMCDNCGQVLSVPVAEADDFVERVQRLTGFHTDIAHVALHGTCASCSAADARGSVDPREPETQS